MQHLYISYPPADYVFAHRLVDDLQTAGYAVFVDAVNEVGSLSWTAETRRAIRTCGAVIMILSPADGRRTGIRHEGVLARRRQRPVYVVQRSAGDLPRYLINAVLVDFTGEYEGARDELLAALPPAADLLRAPHPVPRRAGARRPQPHRARRVIRWGMGLAALALIVGVALVVLGVLPL